MHKISDQLYLCVSVFPIHPSIIGKPTAKPHTYARGMFIQLPLKSKKPNQNKKHTKTNKNKKEKKKKKKSKKQKKQANKQNLQWQNRYCEIKNHGNK